jgi:predicted permease
VTYVRGDGVRICVGDACESKGAAFVKPEFFPLLRPRVALGRVLGTGDQRASTPVAVISNRLWRSQLGGDPQVIGRRIVLDDIPTTIVGVLAPGAVYPPFADVWQPLAAYRSTEVLARRGNHVDSRTFARLRPGVDSARMTRIMSVASARLGAEYPNEQRGWSATSVAMQQELVGNVQPMLLTFAGAAGLILLLVCANVAGLMITRGIGRRRELAIRVAIGASPGRIARQLIVESAGYAALGAALGIAMAAAGVALARRALAAQLPAVAELSIDGRLLAIAVGAAVVCALACGVIPAMSARRRALRETFAAVGAAGSTTPATSRARQTLVSLQFALALVLLVGAGLLTRSFVRAADVDVGFDPEAVYSMRINPPGPADPTQAAALYRRLMDAMATVPGVRRAGFINHAPFLPASIPTTLVVEGRLSADSSRQLMYRTVSSSYRDVMRLTMRSGRWFEEGDERSATPVFIVNETAARRYWPGASPIGARVRVARASQAAKSFGELMSGTIVGVVRDVHQVSQDVAPIAEVYVPYTLEPWGWGMLMVRAEASALPAMREAVRQVDARLISETNLTPFAPMADAVSSRLAPRVLALRFMGAFALTGIALACLGLYGVIAYNVAQRTREIAVRKAVGATNARVLRLVFADSAAMITAGAVVGGATAWASTRWIESLLFETSRLDAGVYLTAAASLVIVAAAATVVPALRASKLDPAIALRSE